MTNKIFRILEKGFVLFTLLLSTGGIIPLIRKQSGFMFAHSGGDPLVQMLWFAIYGISFFMIMGRLNIYLKYALMNKSLLLLSTIALTSVLWSYAPMLTLRRSVALTGTTLFGIYVASRFTKNEVFRFIIWTMGIISVFSLLSCLLLPSYGLMGWPHEGAWRGVFIHKNSMGRVVSFGAISFCRLFNLYPNTVW